VGTLVGQPKPTGARLAVTSQPGVGTGQLVRRPVVIGVELGQISNA
jgi:hypothetical protein